MNINFHVAAFDPGGSFLGVVERRIDSFSKKWLAIAEDYLSANGGCFEASWGGPLEHVVTKYTRDDGVALVTFYVNKILTTSVALLCGGEQEKENLVLSMFVDSLRRTKLVQNSATILNPFQEIFAISFRPLMIAIPWGSDGVTEEDLELVQEISLHLAGAFFLQQVFLKKQLP